ncbi:hypothetical protein DWW36_17085 [Erysipelotrichaceae bacterium AF15-26LB]|nr:hypothetical protein DWW36_17085 [Erysipelotrichaceae bacterium AF15-26LB]RJV84902.1 hypothetical protein DWX45_17950 [Erysipelotrichaceae bacterium AF19-24AC]
MSNKKKQTAVVAVATVLSVSTMVNPIVINAQDVVHEESSQSYERKEAPEIIPPQDLKAKAGTPLKEIKLPENWAWEDEIAILSENRKDYAARFAVDDESYDYTNVKGYHAEGHYIELMVSVKVETKNENSITAPGLKSSSRNASSPSTYAEGDIPINEQNFPDATFRKYLKEDSEINPDGNDALSAAEIEKITSLYVSNDKNIKDLSGIEKFSNLTTLWCNNTNITKLDVSYNTKLETLQCYNNANLHTLNVSGATALKTLNCFETGITNLDVSKSSNLKTLKCYNNTSMEMLNVNGAVELTSLDCHSTNIASLDVSNNVNLAALQCYSNTNLKTLNINRATALQNLGCSNTSIMSLDVSNFINLEYLSCSKNTNLKMLKVDGATALKSLDCYSTNISSLDVSRNPNLETLLCYSNANLVTLNISRATALKTLWCYNNIIISSLDVSTNNNLEDLQCFSNPNLKTLIINGATALKNLNCHSTVITGLDVSNNTNLENLNCYSNNNLKTLNVKKAVALKTLICNDTGITGLDVSNNINLTTLNCSITPLAYLNLGTNAGLTSLTMPTPRTRYLEVTEDTFSIEDKIAGIDKSKVSITSGATYNSGTGVVSDYKVGTPIVYVYDCGTANSEAKTLQVTLNLTGLKSESTISVTATLDKTYDGTAVDSAPAVSKSGSTGAVTYTWEKKKNVTEWENIATAPTIAGTYRVTATVAADDNYKSAKSTKEFTISKADSSISVTESLNKDYDGSAANGTPTVSKTGSTGAVTYTWKKKLNDVTWEELTTAPITVGTYQVTAHLAADNNYQAADSSPVEFTISKADSTISVTESLNKDYDGSAINDTPTVSKAGSTGAVTYAWEKKNNRGDWESITAAPMNAGIYRVTATVAADDNYKSAAATKEFTISQAETSYTAPKDLQAVYGQSLKDITLPTGFAWTDQTLDVGNAGINEFTLTYTPENDNYKPVTDIKVTVTVTKAKNEQAAPISLEGWIYGAAPSAVRAGFRFGQPRFLYSDRMAGTYTDTVPTAAGTWYVKAVVDGTDNYEGAESEVVSFVIEPKSAETDNQIKVPEMSTDTRLDDLVIKDGDKVLVQGTDYDVTQIQDGNKVVVTITFKGNYTGIVVQAYTSGKKDKDMQTDSSDTQKEAGKNESDKKDTLNNANLETVPTGDTTAKGIWTMFMLFAAGVGAFMRKRFIKK